MTKYKNVKFNVKRIVKLYAAGKNVSSIAVALGYPVGHGNNRVRRVLTKAGAYKGKRAK